MEDNGGDGEDVMDDGSRDGNDDVCEDETTGLPLLETSEP